MKGYKMEEKKSVNQYIKQLEDILNKIESGESNIEESIELYKNGKSILKTCHLIIDKMEKEIKIVNEKEQDKL